MLNPDREVATGPIHSDPRPGRPFCMNRAFFHVHVSEWECKDPGPRLDVLSRPGCVLFGVTPPIKRMGGRLLGQDANF